MLSEEIKTRDSTGIQHLDDDVVKKLMLAYNEKITNSYSKGSTPDYLIGSNFNYDILADREISQTFSYVPYFTSERSKFLACSGISEKSNELARIAVDFAYLDEEVARNFDFV